MKTTIFHKCQVVGRKSAILIQDFLEGFAWRWRNKYRPAIKSPHMFLKNVWRFRKELWNFRSFDYSYNLKIFTRSLELTADFLESEDAMSQEAKRDAKDIRKFIRLMEIYQNPMEEAERVTQLDFMKEYDISQLNGGLTFDNPRLDNLTRLSNSIERRSWNSAWKLFARRGQHWWD